MYKKTIECTDFNGVKVKEDYYFNLTKAEVLEFDNSELGGMEFFINKIVKEKDNVKLFKLFKDLILKSYGEKSPDGRRFIKSPEKSEEFTQTEAYSELVMELVTNADEAAKFVNGVCASIINDKKLNSNGNLRTVK